MEEHKETQATSHQKTVLLVNTFVINTARLLNKFAKQCELKLDKVHRRIREVEYTVTMLEQRLSAEKGRFVVLPLPNVTQNPYGRDVGYSIEQIHLGEEMESISATNARAKMGQGK